MLHKTFFRILVFKYTNNFSMHLRILIFALFFYVTFVNCIAHWNRIGLPKYSLDAEICLSNSILQLNTLAQQFLHFLLHWKMWTQKFLADRRLWNYWCHTHKKSFWHDLQIWPMFNILCLALIIYPDHLCPGKHKKNIDSFAYILSTGYTKTKVPHNKSSERNFCGYCEYTWDVGEWTLQTNHLALGCISCCIWDIHILSRSCGDQTEDCYDA